MMRNLTKYLAAFLLFFCSSLLAQPKQFSDYPLLNKQVLPQSKLLSFAKYPELKLYKTALLNGLKDGPNFALNYTVVEIGCGTACQLLVVIDSQGEIVHKAQACVGAAYRLDSRLLVINPAAENPTAFGCETRYWLAPE